MSGIEVSDGRCQAQGIEVSGTPTSLHPDPSSQVVGGRWYRGVRNSHLSAADPSSQVVDVRRKVSRCRMVDGRCQVVDVRCKVSRCRMVGGRW